MLRTDREVIVPARPERWRRVDLWCVGALVLAAAGYAVGVPWARSLQGLGSPSNDVYAFFYPNTQHAVNSLRAGDGLLWNPFQDCGQPFLGMSQVGLLYPVNVVFFVLPREIALLASVVLNVSIAGIGMFLLCRELQLPVAAALGGAVAFQLGGTTTYLASWSPMHIAPYAWLPAAMWAVERIMAAPTLWAATLLGSILALQILPGFVQISVFTYQLLLLRILWVMAWRRSPRPIAAIIACALGCLLPFAITAVQFLPSLEVARASVRGWRLADEYIGNTLRLVRPNIYEFVLQQGRQLIAFAALPLLFGRGTSRVRSDVAFYAVAAVLHVLLSLGPGTPVFDVYAKLPLATAFRGAARLLWVTDFAVSVLTACGITAILSRERGWTAIVASIVGGVLLLRWSAVNGIRVYDWLFVALIVVSIICARSRLTFIAQTMLPLLLVVRGVVFGPPPPFDLQRGDVYGDADDAFRLVRERLTSQDRVFIVSTGMAPYALTPKTASLYRVPGLFDYETQASLSYAQYFTYMREDRPLQELRDWYWNFNRLLPTTTQRSLLDLTASRYLIIHRDLQPTAEALQPPLRQLGTAGPAVVYENPQALARARYVPRVAVMPIDEVLPALAHGTVDVHQVAVITDAPSSGFMGTANGTGSAEIVSDAAERITIRVRADAPGFLYLADQFFPGWIAQVNGEDRQILRANHTFRLVEVPAGDSEVVFVYRPLPFRVGAAVSLLTLAALTVVWISALRR